MLEKFKEIDLFEWTCIVVIVSIISAGFMSTASVDELHTIQVDNCTVLVDGNNQVLGVDCE